MPDSYPNSTTESPTPVRGAERNRSLTHTQPQDHQPLLPKLDTGVTLLDIDGDRGVPILQSLVLDRLLMHDGPAFWVDAQGHATTAGLAQLAPSPRLLDRIHVARGFTAYQHYSAVQDLQSAVSEQIQTGATRTPFANDDRPERTTQEAETAHSLTPSLVIAPAIDAMYRAEDTLSDEQASTLQARCLATLTRYADGYDVPVLVTRQRDDAFTDAIETTADRRLQCERTKMGPRFVGEEFETLVYPVGDGSHYQTTLAYWHDILLARATQVGIQPKPNPPETQPETTSADPVADALAGLGGQ